MAVSKEQLFKETLAEKEIELLTGGSVRVRGLSRVEVLELRGMEPAELEPKVLALAVVEPAGLTPTDARRWMKAKPSKEIEEVVDAVWDLSGMGPDAGKAAYKSFRGEPGA